jgi:transketolase
VVNNGIAIGIDTFGESAPAGQLYDYFGLNPQAVCKAVYALLDQAS